MGDLARDLNPAPEPPFAAELRAYRSPRPWVRETYYDSADRRYDVARHETPFGLVYSVACAETGRPLGSATQINRECWEAEFDGGVLGVGVTMGEAVAMVTAEADGYRVEL